MEVTQISADEFSLDEIIQDPPPEKYFYTDNNELLIASNALDTIEQVHQLIHFLFQNDNPAVEIYKDTNLVVLDLSPFRSQLIDFNHLDSFYQNWIDKTGRENTMDEYGMMLDYIGHAQQTMKKRYLLMVISSLPR